MHAQSDRWRLVPIETCYSGPKVAGLHAQNLRWGQGTIETSNSSAKVAVCMHKTTSEGWNPCCLFILVLSKLLCVLKTTDEVWDPYRLVSLVLKSLFCMRWGLEPLQTCHSGANHSGLMHSTTGYICDSDIFYSSQNSLFCMLKPQMRAGTHIDLSFWWKSRCFACTKRKVRSGIHREL